MAILVTGAAGFIGSYVSRALLARGEQVIGIDNLNDYYDPALKEARLAGLEQDFGSAFNFYRASISDRQQMENIASNHDADITQIIHLAAQAGVRYSIDHPMQYMDSNLLGHMVMQEMARHMSKLEQFIYASSSSVYGQAEKVPFSVTDPVDHPISLYAATKKSCELLAESYVNLYQIPTIGLRFFTVYGPFGRPDMAYFSFTKAIMEDQPIRVFNHGKQQRDFTYIDDIVSGVLACADLTPQPTHRIYNLGNNHPVELMQFIRTIEQAVGKEAELIFEDAQPGDVTRTYADISESKRDLGFDPHTSLEEGIARFVAWYKTYYQ